MGYIEYLELVLASPWLYVAALLIAFPVYIFMLRKQINSVFDPLFLDMFFAAIGTATVIFLLFTENIETKNFVQYILSEFLYLFCLTLIPLRLGKLAHNDELLHIESSRRLLQCIFLVSAAVFLVSQTLIYVYNGIPLFLGDRLDYYAAGNGIGIFSRLIEMSSYLCWYLLLHKYTYKWKIRCIPKAFDAFLLAGLVLSCILSGSKSALLVAVFVIFYFRSLHRQSSFYPEKADRSLKRIQTLTLGIASGVVVLVLLVTGFAANFAESLGALLTRVVSAGDVYFMTYPGSNLHDLNGTHAFLALFGPTLAVFRIVDPGSLGTSLGFQIFHNVVQSTKDLGPQSKTQYLRICVLWLFWLLDLLSDIGAAGLFCAKCFIEIYPARWYFGSGIRVCCAACDRSKYGRAVVNLRNGQFNHCRSSNICSGLYS